MPQKRNPDAAELVRAKTGRLNGSLVALLTVMKGLPLAYQKDMQEDKVPVFEAADALELCLAATAGMVRDMRPDRERLRAAPARGYSTATDLADWLVRALGPAVPPRASCHRRDRQARRGEGLHARRPAARRTAGGRAGDHRCGIRGARCRAFGRQPHQLRRHRAGAGARGRRRGAAQVSCMKLARCGIALLLLIGLALAGCGKKGDPQPPPDEPNTYPRVYPSV